MNRKRSCFLYQFVRMNGSLFFRHNYRERNKNKVPILMALIDKMYPDNSIWNSL